MKATKVLYLGDDVYATLSDTGIYPLILTTGSHREQEADNVIYFEEKLVDRLLNFLFNPELGQDPE